jgi:hypothetical protein
LTFASQNGHERCTLVLLEAGADRNKGDWEERRDWEERSATHAPHAPHAHASWRDSPGS